MNIRSAALVAASLAFAQFAHASGDPRSARPGFVADTTPPQANAVMAAPAAPLVTSLNEGFDDITLLAGNGWFMQNNSAPLGLTNWFQGTATNATPTPGPFNAFDGAPNAYIGANFNNTTGGAGTISNWLLTPPLDFGNAATLTFYTRKPTIGAGMTDFPDRLEVRLSTNGASTNVGATGNSVGDFTTLLLSVNPTLAIGVYPQTWTQYTVTGLPHNNQGRIAFRYFVTNGGPTGANSDYIGIDRVTYNTGAPEYQVGGSVSGLAGSGLVLRLNGTTDLPVNADGSFTFPPYIIQGGNYDVAVATQPSTLSQTCAVTNGNGTVGGTVTNVQVACTTNAFSVGGNLSGLAGSGLSLQLNGGQDLAVAADGSFAFPTSIVDGSAYAVTVATQPTNLSQTCIVSNGSGTLAGANVANVQITCTTLTYSIGGTLSGLAGSGLSLQLNGGQDLAVSADGSFTFPTSIVDGSNYVVTVATQPTDLNQNCVASNESGTLAGANVADVQVTCTTLTYSIGGNLSGLAGSGLSLQLNGGQDLAASADGSFVFPTSIVDGSSYVVTVATQPTDLNQNCVASNESGTLAGANVTNVQVTCTTLTYFIGGSVSGLLGSGLVLHLDSGQDVPVSADGSFLFANPLTDGSPYLVSVDTQPGSPNQICSVTSGSGTLAGGDVTSVQVSCAIVTHTVGGTVIGLDGSGLVLQLNGADDLPVPADGSFMFSQQVQEGAAYAVTVSTQPNGGASHVCLVNNGTGTMNTQPVSDITVMCDVIFISGFEAP